MYQYRKIVAEINGKQFFKDIRESSTLIELQWAKSYIPVSKSRIWRLAQDQKIRYKIIGPTENFNVKRMIIY
jgi:hypothetical protein